MGLCFFANAKDNKSNDIFKFRLVAREDQQHNNEVD